MMVWGGGGDCKGQASNLGGPWEASVTTPICSSEIMMNADLNFSGIRRVGSLYSSGILCPCVLLVKHRAEVVAQPPIVRDYARLAFRDDKKQEDDIVMSRRRIEKLDLMDGALDAASVERAHRIEWLIAHVPLVQRFSRLQLVDDKQILCAGKRHVPRAWVNGQVESRIH